MEATVLSVGKSVLDGALGYAKSAVAEEVALQLGVRRDQVFITNELEMMQAFLMSADEERDDNRVVKVWVKQVRDVAYDVEDCLLDLAVRLDKQSWWRIGRTLLDRHYVAQQMKELRANVEDVSQRNQRYSLIKSSKPAKHSASITGATTIMSGTDEARRQREEANRILVRRISDSEDNCLRVISVWGKGCTTHASIVKGAYDHIKIHNKFKCHAFIRFVHPFCLTDFFQDVVQQFYTNSLQEAGELEEKATLLRLQLLKMMRMTEVDDLAHELNKYLSEKSYLIVLDNINTIEDWEHVKTCFPDNKNGSRILVSTQKAVVANVCVGADNGAPEHQQLFADQTLHVFYKKGSGKEKAGSSSNTDNTAGCDSSSNMKMLNRTKTMLVSLMESELIGRVKDKKNIINLIEKGSQEREVISVWGMGGLGKTTLVKDVYQSQEISDKFEKRACVTIMRPFNPDEILKNLATQLKEQTIATDWADLKKHLEGKKYLIVLDDLLSITEWDTIQPYFPTNKTPCCIMVTTRIKDIAIHCSYNDENVYGLHVLEHKHAHDLFIEKVFPKTRTNLDKDYPELVEPAKLILKKCDGLPLAIVTVGGFLSNQPKTASEWRKFYEHISVELEMNPELGAIKTILMKSYDGLPYQLKACFLYVPIFPEDYEISCKRLLRRWVAEGYASAVRNKSAETIAENFLMELISRSMLLPPKQSWCREKFVDTCQIHDLIREIGISMSMDENVVFRLDEDCSANTQKRTSRHLSINGNWKGGQDDFESMVDMPRVRSITVFGKWKPFFISDKMRMLRVLDLEDAVGLVGHHLDHVWRLLHLRYLSLRGCGHIYHLPDSLGNLRQLETLDVTDTQIVMLPKAITKLEKLRYLYTGWRNNFVRNKYGVYGDREFSHRDLIPVGRRLCAECFAPRRLGIDGFNRRDACTYACCATIPGIIKNLKYGSAMLPRGSRKLKALHTLRHVDLIWGADGILREIRGLTGLRKLGLHRVTQEKAQKVCSVISHLSHLESLSLWIVQRPSTGVTDLHLGEISTPPKNLQSLKLWGAFLDEFPAWIKELRNLVKLEIWFKLSCESHDAAMEVLGNLPNLSILCMSSLWNEGTSIYFKKGAFGSLEVLQLEGFSHTITFEERSMPKLEHLEYRNGGMDAPVFSGLQFLRSIKKVLVQYYFFRQEDGEVVAKFKKEFHDQIALNRNADKIILKLEVQVSVIQNM